MRILDRSTLRDVQFSHERTDYGLLVTVTVVVEPDSDDEFDISDFDEAALSDDAIETFLMSAHADIEHKIRAYALPFKRAWSKHYSVQPSHEQRFSLVVV